VSGESLLLTEELIEKEVTLDLKLSNRDNDDTNIDRLLVCA